MAHSVGVTFEPEIMELDLDPRSDVMLVLATDGVWDVLSAEDIRKVRTRFFCSYVFRKKHVQRSTPTQKRFARRPFGATDSGEKRTAAAMACRCGQRPPFTSQICRKGLRLTTSHPPCPHKRENSVRSRRQKFTS